jgi:hypothetical protein
MPSVEVPDEKQYAKAIGLLIELGGFFRTRPTRQLVIGPAQFIALRQAGLVPKTTGAKKRRKANDVPDAS